MKTTIAMLTCLFVLTGCLGSEGDTRPVVTKGIDLCQSGVEPFVYQDGFNVGRKSMENMAKINCLLALKCDIGKTNKDICKKLLLN